MDPSDDLYHAPRIASSVLTATDFVPRIRSMIASGISESRSFNAWTRAMAPKTSFSTCHSLSREFHRRIRVVRVRVAKPPHRKPFPVQPPAARRSTKLAGASRTSPRPTCGSLPSSYRACECGIARAQERSRTGMLLGAAGCPQARVGSGGRIRPPRAPTGLGLSALQRLFEDRERILSGLVRRIGFCGSIRMIVPGGIRIEFIELRGPE